jgi:hypothetical protein
MSETLLGVIIGGMLATIGGFIQSWYVKHNENKAYLRSKRDEAYLGYIEALLQLKENQRGEYFKNIPKNTLSLDQN